MFGRWSKSRTQSQPVDVSQLERLAPMAGKSLAELHVALGHTERLATEPGPVEVSSDDFSRCFLERGQLHITTHNGANVGQ